MRRNSKAVGTLAAATSLALLGSGLALADQVTNTLDSSVDSVAEVMPLNVGGSNGTTTLYVVRTDGDGNDGCNLNGKNAATLTIASSNTAVATVSPATMTFHGCGSQHAQTLTVTPITQGSSSITVTGPASVREGSMDYTTAAFTANVVPPANTAPAVSISGVTAGVEYNKGSVPAATCNVTDTEDGNSSFAATLSTVTGTNAADGLGNQTASCSYTDSGGLRASSSVTYTIVDPSAPVITATKTPAQPDGLNGWYTGNVGLVWDVSEPESPNSLSKTGCVNQTITADQVATDYSCSATSAGGNAAQQDVSIKRDGTAPTVSAEQANTTWTNAATVTSGTFTASDDTSGLADSPADASFTLDATAQSTKVGDSVVPTRVTRNVLDNAGNGSTAVFTALIDRVAPTVTCPSTAPTFLLNQVNATVTAGLSDALSGSASTATASAPVSALGQHTVTVTGADNAGNSAQATCSYMVTATFTGMNAAADGTGMAKAKAGSAVPLKWRITDANGAGVTGLTATDLTATSGGITCSTTPTETADAVAAGSSSLQDLGDGYYQYNWKTVNTWANSCRKLTLRIAGDGTTGDFHFTK